MPEDGLIANTRRARTQSHQPAPHLVQRRWDRYRRAGEVERDLRRRTVAAAIESSALARDGDAPGSPRAPAPADDQQVAAGVYWPGADAVQGDLEVVLRGRAAGEEFHFPFLFFVKPDRPERSERDRE